MADHATAPVVGDRPVTVPPRACQAPLPGDQPIRVADAVLCGRAATRLVLIACLHHGSTFRVCETCYADLADGPAWCCECWETDGHTCVLLVTDLTGLEARTS